MPKYYCDYCKSYLTHDSMSVRKSHLIGKNHIKYYCDYYEEQAKKLGIWEPNELAYEINLSTLNQGAPGTIPEARDDEIAGFNENSQDEEKEVLDGSYRMKKEFSLPPPPALQTFPHPPPSVFYIKQEYKKSILKVITQ
ncbi:hypothetical protein BABINDRAFT_50070 [Babjeviella inositovora NRRL Y-12698]|uniref:Matrin-type domain-containing protein n=1 Tax=Babjeviella inositovora NRRL Y-12698 TaxID=984486 RepID=A0A1E3QPK8_9ASCO|nr:uncharacterized protein BABINDRAFT_50070 [Babjeviella inositovora NRRL Y-12698]ODQ79394.1 hypothetical protein BABINDRAFT_50070 [Babjeviella inositovora NRRL Y-12698]